MKNNAILKTLVVIFVAVSLFAMASCTMGSDSVRYAEWTLSEDERTLGCVDIDDKEYTYNFVGMGENLALVGELYIYQGYVENSYGELLTPFAPGKDSDVIFLSDWYDLDSRGNVYIFVREGATVTDEYVNYLMGASDRTALYLTGEREQGIFSDAELSTLRASVSDVSLLKEIDVRTLRGTLIAEVFAYSADRCLVRAEGAIFEMDGEKYYVDYRALDNSHFDADGNFSYRSGTVLAERLAAEKKESVERVMNRTVDFRIREEFEEGRYTEQEPDSVEDGVLTLVILTLILGLCIPLVPIGYVVVYAVTEKKRSRALGLTPRKLPTPLWVMLAGGVLWLLAAIVLLIIFATV